MSEKHAGNPMRWRETCPDCGFIFDEHKLEHEIFVGKGVTCSRCGVHYSAQDFDDEMHEKHQAQHHNHAKADLSGEETL